MRLADVTMQGGHVTITHPTDVLQANRYDNVSFQLACPVFFVGCEFWNSYGVLDVTREEPRRSNDWNKALRIEPRDDVDPERFAMIVGAKFDRCFFPVLIYGRDCSIHYDLSPGFKDRVQRESDAEKFFRQQAARRRA